MGVGSIVLGILSLLFAMGGFVVSFIPGVGAFLGAFLSFASPVLALIGVVLGGVGVSRARSEGIEGGTPMAGLIVSGVAFFPAFLVAISCGICDAMCAGAMIDGQRNRGSSTPWWLADAGVSTTPGFNPAPIPTPPPTGPSAPIDPTAPPPIDPTAPPPQDPTQPPPAFPPPPLEPSAPPSTP